jgi:dTDP-4-amino-4,6-dideoxygalactose transaminase
MKGLEADIERRRRLVRRYRERLAGLPGVILPYSDDEVGRSSCYVMPVLVEDPALRDPLREWLSDRLIQTSVLYPAVHEFTEYAGLPAGSLPRSELVARSQTTLPLYPHLTEPDQDRVVEALAEGLATLRPRTPAGAS